MEVLEIFQKRYSAPFFMEGEADLKAIDRILEAGRLAPSAKNRQAWRFIAVLRPDMRKAVVEACYGDARLEHASCFIAACTTNVHYTMPNGQPSYPLDLAFAVSYMDLQAAHEGLGSIILGTYNEQAIRKLLSVPHAMRVVLIMAVGALEDKGAPYKNRLPKHRVISYNHW